MELFRDYGKTAGVFAAAAFLLSLLVGALAQNPFGVVLLRALLFALMFGVLGAGCRFLYTQYLSQPSGSEAEKAPDAPGAAVDIVLPEETPSFEPEVAEADEVEDLDEETAQPVEGIPEGIADIEPVADEGPSAGDSLENGIEDSAAEGGAGEELLPAIEEAEPVAAVSPDEESPVDALPDLMDLDAADRAPQKSRGRSRGGAEPRPSRGTPSGLGGVEPRPSRGTPSGLGGVEPRPSRGTPSDLGGVEPRPGGGVEPRSGKGGRVPPGRPEDAVRNAVSEEDPASLARAIRTFLKRDDKG